MSTTTETVRTEVLSGPIPRDALGLGLRPAHYTAIFQGSPAVGFFEVIAENVLGASELPARRLAQVADRYPVVVHGVSLNLMGAEPLDLDYLRRLRDLIAQHGIPWATDHLCWAASGGVHHHDLLPAPYAADLVNYVADRAAYVQELLGVPFGIENLSSYLGFARDELTEWEFLRRVLDASGCHHLLDINNIYVSSVNHGFDPGEYLDAVSWDRVLQVHLAGHQELPSGILHDTHDRAVTQDVWALYAEACRRGGAMPTMIEWDEAIPPLQRMLDELEAARSCRDAALALPP